MSQINDISRKLRARKQEVGISEERLAAATGLSRTAIRQALNDPSKSSVANLFAVANQLGLELETHERMSSYQLRRMAALRKARKLMALVQGNSQLELQGVDERRLRDMIEQTADEIMAGPPRNLWN